MGFVFIAILLLFGLGFWAWIESPHWFASLVNNRTEFGFRHSLLPEQEQTELIEIVQDLTSEFREGHLVWSDLPAVVDTLSKSQFAPIAFAVFIEASIISPSGLTNEEKVNAHRQLLRLQWSEIEKVIDKSETEDIWATIAEQGSDSTSIRFKKNLTDPQLRLFFEKAQKVLDANEIPLDPFPFDPSEALKQALQPYLPEGNQPAEAS